MSFERASPALSEKHSDVDLEGKHPPVVDVHRGECVGEYVDEVIAGRLNDQANSRTKSLILNNPVFRSLTRFENRLNKQLDIEVEGINRIPPSERSPPSEWNMGLLWFTMNASVTTFPTGMLGPQFGLSLGQSIGALVLGTFLGGMMTGFTASLSPKTGLRQIGAARYAFGFYGAKFCAVMNIVICVGFGTVNLVVVGQLLNAVSNYKVPLAIGILIMSIVSFIISVFGYRYIHTFEKYFWIMGIIFGIIIYAELGGKYAYASLPAEDTGATDSGDFLSFFAIVLAGSAGWTSMGGDYYVHYPENTSQWKIWILVTLGISIPTIFMTAAGCVLGTASVNYPPFADAYNDDGFGALLLAAYRPQGLAKAIVILGSFTCLGNNVGSIYSCGLDFQLLGNHFHAVPRFIWSLVTTVIMLAFAIAGRSHLADLISDFVSMLGYWAAPFFACLLIEDRYFRRKLGYNLMVWDTASKLPPGIAAMTTVILAFCCGGVPGMDQTWYIGPVAAKIGAYGGDVGMLLAFAISVIVYPVARTLELRYFGR